MALQPLPAPAPVDYSRVGHLTISRESLCGILRLPEGHAVSGFNLTAAGDLIVAIAGEDMPELGLSAAPVRLICSARSDGSIELAWEHNPEKRWRLR